MPVSSIGNIADEKILESFVSCHLMDLFPDEVNVSMKTRPTAFGILAIAAALVPVYGATSARAQTQVYTLSGQWDLGSSTTPFTGSLSVPQFNSSLGVLNLVSLQISFYYVSAVTVSGPNQAYGDYAATGVTTLQDPGNNINQSTEAGWGAAYYLPSVSFYSGGSTSTDTENYSSPAVLSEFSGNGNVSLSVTSSQSVVQTLGPIEGTTFTLSDVVPGDNEFNDTITLTYSYSVPEPTSLSLFGLAMLGVFFRKRRTRSEEDSYEENPFDSTCKHTRP